MDKDHKISVVITYCTNEYRYINKCIEHIKNFANQIIIIVCDHFFSGDLEDHDLLKQTYFEHSDCEFIQFKHLKDRLYSQYIHRSVEDNDWLDFWYATTRYIPFFFLKEDTEYILYLDADEIVETDRFIEWLNTNKYKEYDACRWLQHFYFRDAKFRSKIPQTGGLMVKKRALNLRSFMHPDDRCGIFHKIEGEKIMSISGLDGKPMIHHYSWVKSKNECLRKAKNWGQHWEKDWPSLIEEEYSRNFSGKDFIDNREYEILEKPFFDPLKVSLNRKKIAQSFFPNVRKLDDKEIFKRELAYEFGVPYRS